MNTTVIIVAAGRGSRMGMNKNKLLYCVNGKTIVEHTIDRFYYHNKINSIVVVHSEEDTEAFHQIKAQRYDNNIILTTGGITRSISVKNGIAACPKDTELVLIHDGARPFVSDTVIDRCVESTERFGTGIAAIPIYDTVGDLSGYRDEIVGYLKRDKMILIQTPQGFLYDSIADAYRNANPNINFTDDSSVYLKYVGKPRHCGGDIANVKITYREDLKHFDRIADRAQQRVGNGYDAHRFAEGRKLILGGVDIPSPLGLQGHSDADVLVHAVMDSLLSACGKPDIGTLFPDTDERYKNISSIRLLTDVQHILEREGAVIVNISATVIAEKPHLAEYIEQMKQNMAEALLIEPERISVSATTTEGMGFTGRGEGIAASAVSLVTKGY